MQSKTASEKITVNTIYNDNKHSGYCVLVFVLLFYIYLLCNGLNQRIVSLCLTKEKNAIPDLNMVLSATSKRDITPALKH